MTVWEITTEVVAVRKHWSVSICILVTNTRSCFAHFWTSGPFFSSFQKQKHQQKNYWAFLHYHTNLFWTVFEPKYKWTGTNRNFLYFYFFVISASHIHRHETKLMDSKKTRHICQSKLWLMNKFTQYAEKWLRLNRDISTKWITEK